MLLVSALGLVLFAALLVDGGARPAHDDLSLAAGTRDRHSFRQFTTNAHWESGRHSGTRTGRGTLHLASPTSTVTVRRQVYDRAVWTSPWVSPRHGVDELIPSWDAHAPAGTFVTVRMVARTTEGRRTRWKTMGRWAYGMRPVLRRSAGLQEDALSTVATDTMRAKPGVTFTAYRLSVQLHRRQGTTARPRVRSVHAVASRITDTVPATSEPLLPAKVLAVPRYSQMIHTGEYPRYGGGGEAWCSPTSLSMVLAYYGAAPTAREYAWVDDAYADPWVDEVARRVYDHAYEGTGNWPFNTAYAGTRLPRAVVTRLSSLRDAERFIAQGVPLIVSVSFSSGQLDNAPISSTNGHLLVIAGFNRYGNVVVNDPAASTNAGVRRVYDRAQFEAAWLRRSHGLAYAVRDGAHRFPRGYVGR
jgi:hypothetical protein